MAAADPFELCPLDPAHQIRKSRMQFHLVRCMKNHNLADKMVCPYNSVHIVDKIHFQSHVASCPDFRQVQSFLYDTEDKGLTGMVSMEQITRAHDRRTTVGEDWDNDAVFYQTYDPIKNSENKPIVRTHIGLSKAKKVEVRMQERRRMALLADETPTPVPLNVIDEKISMEPLRPPRNKTIDDEPKPLRPPRNLQSSSTDEPENELWPSKTNLKPDHEESCIPKDPKASEKVQMPTRKPNLAASESNTVQGTLLQELQINSYSGALESAKSQDSESNGNLTPESEVHSSIEQQLRELDEITKEVEAKKEKLLKLIKAPLTSKIHENSLAEGLSSEQPKKVGRCAANFT